MSEFLLEIGTEELPANFANEARNQMLELGEKWLKNNNLDFEKVRTYSTPRRLVLIVDNLAEKQTDILKELKGPAVNIAYDGDSNPTKALLGFCKSQGLNPEQLEKREFKGNFFVYAEVKQEGKKASELLPQMIQYVFSSLSVTRSMRWGDTVTKFSRPVHWILALLDKEVIDFSIEDIKSGNYTFGHRFLSSGKLEIDSADHYFKLLKEHNVIVDNEERKEKIHRQLEDIAASMGAHVLIPESLLNEVNQLVEFPSAIMGNFDPKYLEVPEVVNVTVMKSHQRYFPLFKNNKLLPNFITISNMNLKPDNIRKGNEKVVRARLDDAIFYYREDLKTDFASNLEELKRVTYFEEIGSIYNKTLRIEKIAHYLFDNYFKDSGYQKEDVLKSAMLCKCDLVTNMVQEFTELQGDIGYYYSLKAGEKEDIAFAIKEHYLPTGNNDSLPSKPLSQIINFADKFDNLVSCFALGKIPTGSKDPFSLRRQCLGIIKTCNMYKISLDINDLTNYAWDILASQKSLDSDKKEGLEKIKEFFTQRLKNELLDRGFRYDLIDAVLNSAHTLSDVYSVQEKLMALSEWVKRTEASTAVMAFARIIRISKEKVTVKVNENLFEKDEEKILYSSFTEIKSKLDAFNKSYNFKEYLNTFETIISQINSFFDGVMVMSENVDVKNNRLALLQEIKDYSNLIADMDKIIMG